MNTDTKKLYKKVWYSITPLLILQVLKEESLPKNKIVKKINSKFNLSLNQSFIYSILSSLQNKGLIFNSPEKITLTEKGKQLRQKLAEDYLNFQQITETHLQN